MRIGIFGGTFNPPHNGHVRAAQEMIRCLQLDRLIMVPTAVPPHKALPEGSPDGPARVQLVRAAASAVPGAVVSDLEQQRQGPSYTVDTLRQLRARYPDAELYLQMGTDMFLSFDQWREPEKICAMAQLVPLLREKADPAEQEAMCRQETHLRESFGARVVHLDNRVLPLSSTLVRRMLAFRCADSYMPPAVLQLIEAHGYYGVGEDWRQLPFEKLKKIALSLLKPGRVAHVAGCADTAEELALRWGADPVLARRAGLLHDVTKALETEEQLLLCRKYGIILSDFEEKNGKLLHAKTGAAVAKHIFGECDAVCQAIYWHTTGKAQMTTLEKILYMADYMEPNRDFPGVEILRQQVAVDLDQAMLTAVGMTIENLRQRGKQIDPNSKAAFEQLQKAVSER